MSRDDGYTRYTMRIPTDLYDRIKEAAGEKSVNAEVLGVLAREYPPPSSGTEREVAELKAEVARLRAALEANTA